MLSLDVAMVRSPPRLLLLSCPDPLGTGTFTKRLENVYNKGLVHNCSEMISRRSIHQSLHLYHYSSSSIRVFREFQPYTSCLRCTDAVGWAAEGHPACKNSVVGCWRSYLSGARCRLPYGPADATATHCLLLQ